MKIKKIILSLLISISCVYIFQTELIKEEVAPSSELIEHLSLFIFQLSLILYAAWLGGIIFKKFKMPGVLGEVIAGIIIGPYCLGKFALPGFPHGIFPLTGDFPVTIELYAVATIASVVLLFLTGLETDIDQFLRFSVVGSSVGISGVVISFVAGDLVGVWFSKMIFGVSYGFGDIVPLFLGVISTATSVGISARLLSARNKMDSPEGVTILSAAVIDDVLGIIVLAIVLAMARLGHVEWNEIIYISFKAIVIWLGFTFFGVVFSQQLSNTLKRLNDKNTIAIISLAAALFLAGVFEKSGLAMIIGAYIMGLSLSKTDLAYLIQDKLSVLRWFFVPIFFCVMGMLVDLSEITSTKIIFFGLIYVIFAFVSKFVGCSVPAWFFNFNKRGSAIIGMGMVPRGEVALIIAGIGLSSGAIPHEVFSVSIIMTFITTLVAPPLLDKLIASDKPVLKKAPDRPSEKEEIVYDMPNAETADFVLTKVINAFEEEGFYVHRMKIPEGYFQIRKDEIFVTLKYSPQSIVFVCRPADVSFLHTLFYDVAAEVEMFMEKLQKLTGKEEIGKKIFITEEQSLLKQKNRIAENISPLAVRVGLKGTNKNEIIEELIDLVVQSGQLDPDQKEQVLQDILARENIMSTGMQDGVAVPHAKTDAVNKLIVSVGVKKEGIDFGSLDNKPAAIFILTLTTKSMSNPYLQYMAEVTRFLSHSVTREKILSCVTNAELYETLIGKNPSSGNHFSS